MKRSLYNCMRSGRFFFVVFFVFFASSAGYADIYMYVDKDGNYYFTDTPTSSKYRLFIRERRPKRSHATGKYDHYLRQASRRHGVDFHLIKAIVKAESNFDPRAVSKRGAKGLMQIMPQNFRDLGIHDPFDPRQNIMGGTRYIKRLLNHYNGDTTLALAAYNAGPNNVNPHRGIPRIAETEQFVEKVMKFYQDFKKR